MCVEVPVINFNRDSFGSFKVFNFLMVGSALLQIRSAYVQFSILCCRSSISPHLEQVSVSLRPNLCS